MGYLVCMGASLQCSFGAAPSTLVVIPAGVLAGTMPAATIMDYAPFVNIPPFGVCTSMSNPAVAAATSAALGVLTPMPCTPAIVAPWTPGSSSCLIGTFPALTDDSVCTCSFGGVVTITSAGQFTTTA